jgi:hypothetical protein
MHGLNEPSFFLMNTIGKVVEKDEAYINPFSRLSSHHSFEALSSACDSPYRGPNRS